MPATRVRYWVLLLTFLTSFIMYMDRVCMGTAAPSIMADFHLSKIAMGWSSSAFNWAYALFQVPGGWMADRYGPRLVLAGAMAWWSVFTAATGFSFNAISLASARLLFGMGEAAAFPASSRALVRWLPISRRAFGQGFQHAGSRFGAAVTPQDQAPALRAVCTSTALSPTTMVCAGPASSSAMTFSSPSGCGFLVSKLLPP